MFIASTPSLGRSRMLFGAQIANVFVICGRDRGSLIHKLPANPEQCKCYFAPRTGTVAIVLLSIVIASSFVAASCHDMPSASGRQRTTL